MPDTARTGQGASIATHGSVIAQTLNLLSLIGLVTGTLDAGAAIADGKVTIEGDATAMLTLVGLMAEPDPAFNVVTP